MHPHPLVYEELIRQHRLDLLRDARRQYVDPFARESRRRRWPRAILALAAKHAPEAEARDAMTGFGRLGGAGA